MTHNVGMALHFGALVHFLFYNQRCFKKRLSLSEVSIEINKKTLGPLRLYKILEAAAIIKFTKLNKKTPNKVLEMG
jgi:hypothetical protein